jgi:hypothetical protein
VAALLLLCVGCAHTPRDSQRTIYAGAQYAAWKFPRGSDQDGALGLLGFKTEDPHHRMRAELGGGRIQADSSDRTNVAYGLLEGDGKITPARFGKFTPIGGGGLRYLALGDDETPAAAALLSIYGHLGLDWSVRLGPQSRLSLLARGGVSFYNRGEVKDSFGDKTTISTTLQGMGRGEIGWEHKGLSLNLFYDWAEFGSDRGIDMGDLALAGLAVGYRW